MAIGRNKIQTPKSRVINTKPHIYFRADASSEIGYGHFVRTLALADMVGDGFDKTFATRYPTPLQIEQIEAVCDNYIDLGDDHFDAFLAVLQLGDIVVLDNYFFGTDYQRKIKAAGCKLVCIDDMHDKHYVADVVINHILTDASLFDVEPYTRLCLGLDWALLRRPFLDAKPRAVRERGHCVVSFGGVDALNLTAKVAAILSAKPDVKKITAIVGDAYSHIDTLKNLEKVEVSRNLSAQQMADLFCAVEFAVLPASTVSIEALACRCPVIAGYYVANQKEPLSMLIANKLVANVGFLPKITDINAIKPSNTNSVNWQFISKNYHDLFATINISLKPINETHLKNTFLWMQNKELKRNFMLKKNISWENHCQWFSSLVNDKTQKIWAIYCNGEHIGNIGLKYIDPVSQSAETWIYIGNKQFHGCGIAKQAYRVLFEILKSEKNINKLTSSIAQWNKASLSMFSKIGFKVDHIVKDEIEIDNDFFSLYKLSITL